MEVDRLVHLPIKTTDIPWIFPSLADTYGLNAMPKQPRVEIGLIWEAELC